MEEGGTHMGDLTIGMNSQMDTTVVSNQFIDYYMPSANGEYVKIYLYILRSVNHHASTFSIEEMAKKFDHTISYVMNALRYWETMQLLQLYYDDDNTLKHINFLDLTKNVRKRSTIASTVSPSISKGTDTPAISGEPEEDDIYQKRPYSLDEKQKLAKDKNFNSAKFITQTYLGKPLGPSQLDILMFIYDGLGFDNDLIDYLVEYCVSKGKKSMRYIETVAIAWAKQGITSVASAKERHATYSQLAVGVMKEFGITSRSLVNEERNFLDRWVKEYHMPDALILEACRRTIRATKKGSFDYADTILGNWHNAGIFTMTDVEKADNAHKQKTAATVVKRSSKPAPFPQRDYDMDSLEKQLLDI